MKRLTIAAAVLGLASAAQAAEQAPDLTPAQQHEVARLKQIIDSEHPKTGDVHIPGADVTLHLGDRYYFLGPEDAKKVLIEGWNNPPGSADGVLGVVLPTGKVFVNSWGAVVTYQATGYVADKDAKSANYDKFLDEVRKGEDERNQERTKGGFPTIHLVGWAQAPTYDPASHSEVWARQFQFGGQAIDTLNYDTRILGRRGVLSLNLVSDMNGMGEARTAANDLARAASFDAGSRYQDHAAGDQKAEFGIAGLVAAGLGVAAAQKFGLLALIALFAKKGVVVILAVAGGLFAKFKKALGLGGKPVAKTSSAAPEANAPTLSESDGATGA